MTYWSIMCTFCIHQDLLHAVPTNEWLGSKSLADQETCLVIQSPGYLRVWSQHFRCPEGLNNGYIYFASFAGLCCCCFIIINPVLTEADWRRYRKPGSISFKQSYFITDFVFLQHGSTRGKTMSSYVDPGRSARSGCAEQVGDHAQFRTRRATEIENMIIRFNFQRLNSYGRT